MAGALKRFKPLLDRVVVERLLPETKTKSGLMIPEKAQGKVRQAKVVAAGPGAFDQNGKLIPMNVSVGDTVMVPEYGGSKVEFEEKEYTVFRNSDIMGIFEN